MYGIDISGGNKNKREYLSINQARLGIDYLGLKRDKFDIGYNFHNIVINSKINMGITCEERLLNVLKKEKQERLK